MSDTLEETQPAHAPLGPSSAEGWATCSDYVNANRGLPDHTTEPAAEGTAAHLISDICLELGLDAEDLVGMTTRIAGYLFSWEESDAALLQSGMEEHRRAIGDAKFYGEQRVDISQWTLPGQFGTLDRAYVTYDPEEDTWWVVISDLKYGRGIAVTPVENKQLMLYALGFYHTVARHVIPEGATVMFRLIIDQPRNSGGGGVWQIGLSELLAFGEWIRDRARLTAEPDPTRTASLAGCIWCRRRRAPGGCDTFDTYMIDLLDLTWDDIDMALLMGDEMTLPRDLTPERRAHILLHKNSIERWLDQLTEECLADAEVGAPTGAVKLVEGNRSPAKWKGKGIEVRPLIEQHLGDLGFTKMLKSPKFVATAIEGNEEATEAILPFIEAGRKKPILVPLADARAAKIIGQTKFDEEGN